MSTLKDRKTLWKMHHAFVDFSMVADTCSYIFKKDVKATDPIYNALIACIYTIYSRPFMQSYGAGKLAGDIVPENTFRCIKNCLNTEIKPTHIRKQHMGLHHLAI